MTLDEIQAEHPNIEIANGQSDGEYATVMLRLFGIKEQWKQEGKPPKQRWVSSHQQLRKDIEEVVRLIKTRTAKNVLDHIEAKRLIGKIQDFIERASVE